MQDFQNGLRNSSSILSGQLETDIISRDRHVGIRDSVAVETVKLNGEY